ncbi:hypothetical protein E9993_17970 [Labilibacter sediminis]|nr:hypothetical protein E9993_17970 [Labilibacter sediminis]
MQQYLKKALFASIILLLTTSVSSQYRQKRNKFFEGLKVQPKAGINMFYGDLVSESRTNYIFGVAAEKELMPYLNARVDINYGSMKGTQLLDGVELPYAYFNNNFIHFNAGASFRPLDLAYGLFKQRLFNPYVVGQFGMIQYNATEYYGGGGGEEPGSIWREVGEVAPTFSMGGGVNFYFTSHIAFSAEFIGTYAFSDRLDGHDVWYDSENNTIETDGNDFFYVATLGVTYLINDSQWKNSPKYNRKAYLRTRSLYKKGSNSKKYKRPSKRKTKRYRR